MNLLATLFRHGSLPIYINVGVSILVLATIVERFVVLFIKNRVPAPRFVQGIISLLQNRQYEKALNYSGSSKLPIARVVHAGLTKAQGSAMEISTAIDEELMRVTPILEKRVANLWSLANIATLIGLIGTIFGLIGSFSGLAAVNPEMKAAFLAKGIAEALNNTAVGLTIAVVCMSGHLAISGVSKKLVAELEVGAVSLENFLIQRHLKK